jgi:hypothetical protein
MDPFAGLTAVAFNAFAHDLHPERIGVSQEQVEFSFGQGKNVGRVGLAERKNGFCMF